MAMTLKHSDVFLSRTTTTLGHPPSFFFGVALWELNHSSDLTTSLAGFRSPKVVLINDSHCCACRKQTGIENSTLAALACFSRRCGKPILIVYLFSSPCMERLEGGFSNLPHCVTFPRLDAFH